MATQGQSSTANGPPGDRSPLSVSPQPQQQQINSFEPLDKSSSNTLKRNPKMEMGKADLLRLLSYLEGELQARDIVIATLKSEKMKQRLNSRYQIGTPDPHCAIARDVALMGGTSSQENNTDQLLATLEALISRQRHMKSHMAKILKNAELRHKAVIKELEEEKRKHQHDTIQSDGATYGFENEQSRLKRELEMEKEEKKKLEALLKKTNEMLDEEKNRYKQLIIVLLAERERVIMKYIEELKRSEDLAQILSEEQVRTESMAEGLEEESKKSLHMEAEMEKQQAQFDIERSQYRRTTAYKDKRIMEQTSEIEELKAEIQVLKEQLASGSVKSGGPTPPPPPVKPANLTTMPTLRAATASPAVKGAVLGAGTPMISSKLVQPTATVSSVPVSGPTTGIARSVTPGQALRGVNFGLSTAPAIIGETSVASSQDAVAAAQALHKRPAVAPPAAVVVATSAATSGPLIPTAASGIGVAAASGAATSSPVPPCSPAGVVLGAVAAGAKKLGPAVAASLVAAPAARGAPPPVPPNKPVVPPKKEVAAAFLRRVEHQQQQQQQQQIPPPAATMIESGAPKHQFVKQNTVIAANQQHLPPPAVAATPAPDDDVMEQFWVIFLAKSCLLLQDALHVVSCKIVIFDLETTGLAKNDEIIQIAACSNESSFNVYIIPSKPISKGASTITGLQSFDGDLYLNSKKVQAFPAKAAFLEFLKYLDTFQSGIILVAHNGFRFDVPKLLKIAYELDSIVQFKTIVKGFSDSLMIFKNILKERRKEKKSFSIESLVKCFLPDANTAELHNAVYDVKILQQLLIKLEINEETIKKSVKSIDQISYEQKLKLLEASNKYNLQTFKNVVSSRIVNKMAKAGIVTDTLKRVFDKNGFDGIRLLFSECVNGKPRITTNKRIIENICKVFTLNV